MPLNRPVDLAALRPNRVQLAAIFGTSVRWIGELRSIGVLPPAGATLPTFVAAWVAHKAAGGASNE